MSVMSHYSVTALRTALSLFVMLAALAAPAAAATSTWTAAGGTSNFSDTGNWDAFPTPNCIMVFNSGSPFASKGAPVNDLIGLTIDQLNVYAEYSISGNAITCKNINDHCAATVNISMPISTAGSAVLTVTVLSDDPAAVLNLSGKLSGAGPVSYAGPGIKRLNGTVNNTITGLSIVAGGILKLDSTAAESIAGPLQVDSGASVIEVRAPAIKNSVIVTVNGTFNMSATTGNDGTDTELIGGLAGTATAANISLGANTLGCTAQLAPTNYIGGFSGTGGFRQSVSGIEVLSGTAFPYTGTTRLVGGEIHIWGSLIGSPVTVTSGTLVLANNATVGAVTLSGAASVLSFNETISAMTMRATTPSLTMSSSSTFVVVSKSPTDYASVSTAEVNISGAVLSVDTSLYSPAPVSSMTIITNTGANPVVGTFAGLAQDATVVSSTNSGTTFIISYTGGTGGHDVTLTGVTRATDITPPALTLITSGSITGNSATIAWTSGELATSQVEYGLTTAYGTKTTLDSSLVTVHSVGVTGLAGSTTYHYRVRSSDAAGNLAISADYTFATAADTTAPVATAITAGSISPTTAEITWTTNEVSDSQVEYGLTTAYGTLTTLDTSMVTAHSVTITGLAASTAYHYRVLSRDGSGNVVTSADGTFSTTGYDESQSRCGSGSGVILLGMLLALTLRLSGLPRFVRGSLHQPKK